MNLRHVGRRLVVDMVIDLEGRGLYPIGKGLTLVTAGKLGSAALTAVSEVSDMCPSDMSDSPTAPETAGGHGKRSERRSLSRGFLPRLLTRDNNFLESLERRPSSSPWLLMMEDSSSLPAVSSRLILLVFSTTVARVASEESMTSDPSKVSIPRLRPEIKNI